MDRHITAPLTDQEAKSLRAGDYVYITGTVYTARDAAHKRMQEALEAGERLPFELENNIIYYLGPSPAREGNTLLEMCPEFFADTLGIPPVTQNEHDG